jgi:hypothetical protein
VQVAENCRQGTDNGAYFWVLIRKDETIACTDGKMRSSFSGKIVLTTK